MITKPTLDTKKSAGAVGSPVYCEGETTLIPQSSAIVSDAPSINGTASSENLSAKFKNPRVTQDVNPLAANQYEDHN